VECVDSAQSAELRAVKKRVKALEEKLQLVREASALVDSLAVVDPKKTQAVTGQLVTSGHSIKKATKVCGVNRSTFGYRNRPRTPCNTEIRRMVLTDSICQVHAESRGTHGYRRVQATIRDERDLVVNQNLSQD